MWMQELRLDSKYKKEDKEYRFSVFSEIYSIGGAIHNPLGPA
jgi:hypothetical protein